MQGAQADHTAYWERGSWRCAGRPRREHESVEQYAAVVASSTKPHYRVNRFGEAWECVDCQVWITLPNALYQDTVLDFKD